MPVSLPVRERIILDQRLFFGGARLPFGLRLASKYSAARSAGPKAGRSAGGRIHIEIADRIFAEMHERAIIPS